MSLEFLHGDFALSTGHASSLLWKSKPGYRLAGQLELYPTPETPAILYYCPSISLQAVTISFRMFTAMI
jgi:hypothetical protein